MRALLRGQDFLRDPAVVEFLVRRRGEFDRAAQALCVVPVIVAGAPVDVVFWCGMVPGIHPQP